jgi:hypothetical protein
MGFIGGSEFLILRFETDCNAAKFTRKQSQEREFSPAFAVPAIGPVRSETGPEIVVIRSKSAYSTRFGEFSHDNVMEGRLALDPVSNRTATLTDNGVRLLRKNHLSLPRGDWVG